MAKEYSPNYAYGEQSKPNIVISKRYESDNFNLLIQQHKVISKNEYD